MDFIYKYTPSNLLKIGIRNELSKRISSEEKI